MAIITPDQVSAAFEPLVSAAGTRLAKRGIDLGDGTGIQQVTTSGGTSTPIAASTVANTTIKNSKGRVARVTVNVVGTNAMQISDLGGLGVLCTIPASAGVGTVWDFQVPFPLNITVLGSATNPGVTVVWD